MRERTTISEAKLFLNRELPDELLARLAASRGLTLDDLAGPTVEITGTATVVCEPYSPADWSGPAEGGGCYVAEVRVTDAYLDRDPPTCVSDPDLMDALTEWVIELADNEILEGCSDE